MARIGLVPLHKNWPRQCSIMVLRRTKEQGLLLKVRHRRAFVSLKILMKALQQCTVEENPNSQVSSLVYLNHDGGLNLNTCALEVGKSIKIT